MPSQNLPITDIEVTWERRLVGGALQQNWGSNKFTTLETKTNMSIHSKHPSVMNPVVLSFSSLPKGGGVHVM